MTNIKLMETDADLSLMSTVLKISETTARVMANRGIRSKNTALSFLYPAYEHLHDTLCMKDVELALWHICEAIDKKERITIYGDYDVDGVMGTVILHKTLNHLQANVHYYIPHRVEEGYGLNKTAVQKLADDGTKLIIAVDNGISAVDEVAEANRLKMRVVIIDHHEPGDELPQAAAIVDPKQPDCPYPFTSLCAAGLAYKIAEALYEKKEVLFEYRDELLALAAIATLCDIVTLTDENRLIVKLGLDIVNNNKLINPGLGSLIMCRGYLDKTIDTYAVGYIIGPCINATGRLGHAKQAVELLLAAMEEKEKRISLAQALCALNEERKTLTASGVEQAMLGLSDSGEANKVLVLVDKTLHESVTGIVAGRIRDTYNRPCIVLTQGESDMKGSGRSIECFDLFSALHTHRDLFIRFGGHAMAAGLSLAEENIPLLREALNKNCTLSDADFEEAVMVDGVLDPAAVTLALSDELARLAPFGKGNPEPVFAAYKLQIENVRIIDEKNTLIFSIITQNGKRVKGIAFGLNDKIKRDAKSIDAVFNVETNVFNGNRSVQMRIKDFVC